MIIPNIWGKKNMFQTTNQENMDLVRHFGFDVAVSRTGSAFQKALGNWGTNCPSRMIMT